MPVPVIGAKAGIAEEALAPARFDYATMPYLSIDKKLVIR
jgi:hypothetical protein